MAGGNGRLIKGVGQVFGAGLRLAAVSAASASGIGANK